ncbi:PAS domain S-box protein [Opitutus sp. GAS368]|jgi:PAS domain S-box-containing protein|uniref:PAS domain S-box protein n=1 Tax=Opitutus sp. GAS368 TaxID=1882749 RepID=UPI00087973FF|nr:PAS domain S-box protein [Opitutus sp. GAS368]SDR81800.1 PAS domain S-box-containing protein [Opitutus sp. GAS368]
MIQVLKVADSWSRRRKFCACAREVTRWAGLGLALLVLAWVSPQARAQAAIATPRTIRVVLDNHYAPYSFRSNEGRLQGILVDQWRAWEKKTGIKVELEALDWGEAVRRMRAGEFDVIDCIVETVERRDYFDFTPPYAKIEVPVFFRNDISGITDLASLKGFPVGAEMGDQHVYKLRAAGVTDLILFQNFEEMIKAAKQRKISVFVADAPSALYLLNKAGIETEFRQSASIFREGIQRAVHKGDTALLQQVEAGFAAIDPGELKQIDEKWFGRTINWYGRYLVYAGYSAIVAVLIIAGLAGWNRLLRKRIQQRTAALVESEQRFRQIAENIHEVFWLTTIDLSEVLYVSPAYEAVWGRSRESAHQDPRSFIAAIHPDDRPRAVEALVGKRERGFDIEYRVVRPDGSVRWIRDRGFPIKDEAAHVYRIAGIAEDITERKLAEAVVKQTEDRIRLIIDTIPMMAWSVRPDGVVDFLNQRWLDYAGLSLEEYVKDPLAVIHPEDAPRVLEKWRANMAAGEPSEDEMRLRRADGEFRWFLVRTAPLRDEQGNIVKWFGSSVDIEDRKEAEGALKRAENSLRIVLDATPAMIHTARPDGYLDYFNARWLDYAGLSLEELQGWAWMAAIHPEDIEGEVKQWRACVASGEPFEWEVRMRRADGEYRWMLHRKVAVRDVNGNIVKWYGSGIDIDDRKKAEEALRQSEERFAAFMDNLPGYAWMKDLQGRYVYVNEMVRGLPGYRSLGKTDAQIWPADLAAEYRANDQQVVATKKPFHTVEHYQQEGKQHHMVGSKFPIFDKTGAVALVGGVGVDITDRVEAEEALRSSEQKLREQEEFYRLLTENTNDFIRMHELDGRSIYASPSVVQLYGREPAHLFQFAHPEDREPGQKWFAHVLAGERQRLIWRVRDKNGSWRWMETQGSLVRHEGRPRVMTVCREVTERKEAEEALRGSERQLHSLVGRLNTVREDEAKRIARELHDDLGQKLTALNMELENLEMKLAEATPGQRAQIARMHATVDQTIAAVHELSSELRLGQLDLLGLTAAIDWQLQEFSRRSGIQCVVTRLDEITNLSDARRTAVFRILQEALTNIVRHAGATRVEISLQAGPGLLALRIHDNGRGITAEELNDRQAIGLLGMHERAQGIGGTVKITGGDGRGTTVLVTAPREPAGRISA